ncbi:HU family DNA-binding protein [Mitsuokella sp. oral taxon 131]|uniref:HU family DNA-binding protein n=1 Tax=Mitsuokella sp. oral taxon 131 TaxID=1321780 RepID=UPI0003AE2EE2|nr:HU family DNA-binding protein [Mitsuokella sp. oral taxon 131]ERL04627.1 DNA-binding protein HU-alpha [Mitsuokella sp. oral taxon 131 str. W9106]
MNRTELVQNVAEKSNLTKKDAEKAIHAFMECVQQALVEGDKVQLIGFGTFETKNRAARKGRNPRTNEPIEIAAARCPVFKAGKALKDAVNPERDDMRKR